MTTKLEIINAMIGVNGEAPVSSPDSTDPSAIQASNKLAIISRQVQSRGWWFNREPNVTLAHNALSGEVIVPSNTLSVDPVNPASALVKRGNRLYDRKNSTFAIGASVEVNIVLQLDIEDLPETAAAYIMDKAVKDFYTDDDGDETKISRLEKRETESFMYLQRENLANQNITSLNSVMGQKLMYAVWSGEKQINFDGV